MAALLYNHLNAEARQIRLLTLTASPNGNGDRIEGTLATHSLDQGPSFDALSYAWGTDTVSDKVSVNGVGITVTRNLYEALCSLRISAQGRASRIWIDAICINQRDTKERNRQVSLMHQIYTSSNYVHIWLGRSWSTTSSFLSFLATLSNDEQATAELDSLHQNSRRTLVTDGVETVMGSPWWSRLWVVQEGVLPNSAIAHLGECHIPFRALVAGLVLVFTKMLSLGYDALSNTSRRIYGHMYKFMAMERRTHEYLYQTHRSSTSVEHDRVYGVLGLLPQDVQVEPDYDASLEDVYEDFAVTIMRRERSLDFLTLSGLHWLKGEDLPSWVPNLKVPMRPFRSSAGNQIDTNNPLATAEEIILSLCARSTILKHDDQASALQVRACVVDTVSCSEQIETSVEEWQRLYVACGAGPDVPQEHLVGALGKQWWHEYGQTLAQEALGDRPTAQEMRHEPERQMAALYSMQPGEHPDKFMALRDVLFGNYGRHQFSSMVHSWSGHTFGNAEPGDVVAVLAGSAVSFVLRASPERGRNTYRLVGWADYEASHARNLEAIRQAAATTSGSIDDLEAVFKWITLV
ncbi:hypothetical protein DOTSEDRAFT_70842 [Dothistroma septosporum NZE10]|uniref:Heterokaryon incompatibility domain-containing protein n=1 Tax=Dothistroma septosporum (strain NZE10 / CBS 128990) TaxID=675120 RepID=N1PRD0_DOTSN|nr:hypothetical protein DOTSEDRAFT_70842 [Dothistroma septosporum NZE10]